MIKSFINDKYGVDEEYWDSQWENHDSNNWSDIEDSDLSFWFSKYFDKQGIILEGGCGPGYYVDYLIKHGFNAIGVEYSPNTLKHLKESGCELPVYFGDVKALDYPDNYFSGYYSGGVVEHTEEGPQLMLQEAYRVLQPGGYFLLTVPYLNISRHTIMYANMLMLRRATKPNKRLNGADSIWIHENKYSNIAPECSGYHFHEYIMSKKEICKHMLQVGFDIVETSPFSIRYGLRDYEYFRKLQKKISYANNDDTQSVNGGCDAVCNSNSLLRRIWHDTISCKQKEGIFSSLTKSLLSTLFGNMVMVVGRKP